jgi:hypothetical protein
MKRISLVAAVLFAGYSYFVSQHNAALADASIPAQHRSAETSDATIADAFTNHRSRVHVSGQGIVVKVLPDETAGAGIKDSSSDWPMAKPCWLHTISILPRE